MNRTLLLARVGLAFFLVCVVGALAAVVMLHGSSLQGSSKDLLTTLAGSLVTVMAFSVHAVYAHNAHGPDNSPSPNQTGPTAPKAE